MLNDGKVEDGTQHAYGQAFVLLAYAHATMAGLEQARDWIGETFELMEQRFWDAQAGLYADEASQDWSVLSGYRGQNANMHACEALQAAFQATGERRYLERAYTVAHNITQRQAQRCGGLIWEHYDVQWQPDWKFNIDDPENLFRPWGYQPGHFTEWAKLLVQLEARGAGVLEQDLGWLLPTAERLFRVAVEKGWDAEYGGLCYSLAPDLTVCDGTSISGCRPRARQRRPCWRSAPAMKNTGTGTSACGPTAGPISSITNTAPGSASWTARTASSATRRARPARSITTPWAPATTSWPRCPKADHA
jgi:mannose/cellobiose epimerase-like protein (N-acyl-D-glucosamine 2-epimerase family)